MAFDPCSDDGFERDLRLAFGTASPCPPPLPFPEADSARAEGTYNTMWSPSGIGAAPSPDPIEVAAIKQHTVGPIFSAFVADIGPVSTGNLWGPRLHYARIGGVEHGAPSALVSSETTPRQLDAISVRVLQKPRARRGPASLVQTPLAQSIRWTITDALGRMVLASDLDLVSTMVTVSTHELATGVYRFSVSGADMHGSAAFTVVR